MSKVLDVVKKLEECQNELKEMGAYGCYLFDSGSSHKHRHITIQMSNENLPDGEVDYNTKAYKDYVVKNVFVGDVCFFSLLTMDEAYNEGVFWGALV